MISPRIQINDIDMTTITNVIEDTNDIPFIPIYSKKYIGSAFVTEDASQDSDYETGKEVKDSKYANNGVYRFNTKTRFASVTEMVEDEPSERPLFTFTSEFKDVVDMDGNVVTNILQPVSHKTASELCDELNADGATFDHSFIFPYLDPTCAERDFEPFYIFGVVRFDITEDDDGESVYKWVADSRNYTIKIKEAEIVPNNPTNTKSKSAKAAEQEPFTLQFVGDFNPEDPDVWVDGTPKNGESEDFIKANHAFILFIEQGAEILSAEGLIRIAYRSGTATWVEMKRVWKQVKWNDNIVIPQEIVQIDTMDDFIECFGDEPFDFNHIVDDTNAIQILKEQYVSDSQSMYEYDFNTHNFDYTKQLITPAQKKEYMETILDEKAKEIENKDPDFDANYIYAREILNSGLPISVAVMNRFNTDNVILAPTAHWFNPNVIRKVYGELRDKGEYNVKFITTGAYGLEFEDANHILKFDGQSDKANNDWCVYFSKDEYDDIARGSYTFPFLTVSDLMVDGEQYKMLTVDYIIKMVKFRGDCTYILDVIDDPDVDLNPSKNTSMYQKFKRKFHTEIFGDGKIRQTDENDKLARQYRCIQNVFPYVNMQCNTTKNFRGYWSNLNNNNQKYILPGSFAYLKQLAIMLKNNPNFLAVAGVTRAAIDGIVGLHLNSRLSNAIADAYNPRNDISINCITDVKPYGYCIWGNRTLTDNLYFADGGPDGCIASSFLDIMVMVCDIKKEAYKVCKQLMFEKDDESLWVRFLLKLSPYLDNLVGGSGIKKYYIRRLPTTERAKVKAQIIIWPVYSIEAYDIDIILTDTEIDVQG